MPIYEYECSQCHEVSDALQKVNDPAPEACPRCGAHHTLSRLVSRTSFVLKGGGWYADLYSSKSKPSEAAETKPGAKTDGSSSGAAAPSAPSTSTSGGSSSTGGGSSGSGTSGSGPVNSAPKVAAAKA
jgi:putative FmdB family regulatory protein